jgi:hypothetical protein
VHHLNTFFGNNVVEIPGCSQLHLQAEAQKTPSEHLCHFTCSVYQNGIPEEEALMFNSM